MDPYLLQTPLHPICSQLWAKPGGSFPRARRNGSVHQWLIDGTAMCSDPRQKNRTQPPSSRSFDTACLKSQTSRPLATTFHVNHGAMDSVLMVNKGEEPGAVKKVSGRRWELNWALARVTI